MPEQEVFRAEIVYKSTIGDLVEEIKRAEDVTASGARAMQTSIDEASERSRSSLERKVTGAFASLSREVDRSAGRVREFDREVTSMTGGFQVMMEAPKRRLSEFFSVFKIGLGLVREEGGSVTRGITAMADAIAGASERAGLFTSVVPVFRQVAVASERVGGFLRMIGIGAKRAEEDIKNLAASMARNSDAAKTMVVTMREYHQTQILTQQAALRANEARIQEQATIVALGDKYYGLKKAMEDLSGEEKKPFEAKLARVTAQIEAAGIEVKNLDVAYKAAGASVTELTGRNRALAETVKMMVRNQKPQIARMASLVGTINTHIAYAGAQIQQFDAGLIKSTKNVERRLGMGRQAIINLRREMEKAQRIGVPVAPEMFEYVERQMRDLTTLTAKFKQKGKAEEKAAKKTESTAARSSRAIEKSTRKSKQALDGYAASTRGAADSNRMLMQYVQPRGMINTGITQMGARATRTSRDVQRMSMSLGSVVGIAGAVGGVLGKLDPAFASVTVAVSQMADQGIRSFSALMSVAGTASEKIEAAMSIISSSMMAFGAMAMGFIAKAGMLGAEVETMEITVRQVARNLATEAGVDLDRATDYVMRLRDEIIELGITTREATTILGSFLRGRMPLDRLKELAQAAKDFGVTVAGMSTSEVLGRFNQFIQAGTSMLLKRLAITTTANMMHKKYADSIGKSLEELTDYEKRMARIEGILREVTTVQGVYNEAMKTAGKQLSSMKRLFEEAILTIGKRFQPLLTSIIFGVNKLLIRFNELSPEVHDTIAAFIKWVAIVGTAVGVTLSLIPAMKAIIALFKGLTKRLLLASPQIAAIVIAIAAIGVVVKAIKRAWDENFGGIQDSVRELVNTFKTELGPIIKDIGHWFNTFSKQIRTMVVLVSQLLGGMASSLSTWMLDLQALIKPVFDTIRDALNGFMRAVMKVFMAIQSLLRGDFARAWTYAESAVVDVLTSIALLFKNTVAKAAVWGWNLIVQVANGIQRAASSILARVMQWIGNLIGRFLAPGSPPKEGPLMHIARWGRGIMETFLRSFALADFGILKNIMAPIGQAMQDAVAAGTLDEQALPGTIKLVRQKVADLLSEFRRTGQVNTEIMASIADTLGEGGRDIMEYIRRLMDHQRAMKALSKVQEEYAEAEAAGFIPEGLKDRLAAAEEEVDKTKETVDWQREFLAAQKDTVDLQLQQLKLLEKMESAIGAAAGAMKEVADALAEIPFTWELPDEEDISAAFPEDAGEKLGLGAVSEEWLAMRERIEEVVQGIKDFIALPLAEKLKLLRDFAAGVTQNILTWLEDITGWDVSGWIEDFGELPRTIVSWLEQITSWEVTGWAEDLKTEIGKAWDWLVEKAQWLYDTLIGESIIPDLVDGIIDWFDKLVDWFKDTKLYGFIENIIGFFEEIGKFVQALAVSAGFVGVVALIAKAGPIAAVVTGFFSGLGQTIALVVMYAGQAAVALAGLAAPVIAVAAAIGALLWGIWQNKDQILGFWQDFKMEVLAVWERLKPSLEAFWNFAKPILETLGKILATIVGSGILFVVSAVQSLWDTIKELLPRMKEIFSGVFDVIYGIVKATILPIINLIVGLFNLITGRGEESKESFLAAWENLKEGIGLILGGLGKIISNAIGGAIEFVLLYVKNLLKRMGEWLRKFGFGDFVDKVESIGAKVGQFFKPFVRFFKFLKGAFGYLKGAKSLGDFFERLKKLGPVLAAAFAQLAISMREKLAVAVENIVAWAKDLWPKIVARLREFRAKFALWAKNTWYNLVYQARWQWASLQKQWSTWKKAIGDWLQNVLAPAIKKGAEAAWGAFVKAVNAVWVFLKANVPVWMVKLGLWLRETWPKVVEAFNGIKDAVAKWFTETFIPWLTDVFIPGILERWEDLKDKVSEWFTTTFVPALSKGWEEISELVAAWFVEDFVPGVLRGWEDLKDAVSLWWDDTFAPAMAKKWDEIKESVATWFTEEFIPGIQAKWEEMKDAVSLWYDETLRPAIKEKWEQIKKAIVEWFTLTLIPAIEAKWNELKDTVTRWYDEELIPAIEDKWLSIKNGIVTKLGEIITAVTDAVGGFIQAGKDLIQGLWDGMSGKLEEIKTWFGDIFGSEVQSSIETALRIKSPPAWAIDIGKNIIEGLGLGLDPDLTSQFGAQLSNFVGQLSATPTATRQNQYYFHEGAFAGAFPSVKDGRDGGDLMRQFQDYLDNADIRRRGR